MYQKIYSVLLVDDDSTCLAATTASLMKWNYQVTMARHAIDAVCLLRQKSFDLVLTDVYMPEINGLELLRHIKNEYETPVILMSDEVKSELIREGLKNGAKAFLLKPIKAHEVRDLWQFCELRKINLKINNTMTRSSPANVPAANICSSSTTENSDDKSTKRTRKFVWTPRLHTRFVEVLLILGYHNAIPKTILEAMNVPAITREQVSSHLQKYRKFVNGVLDGKISRESSKYCTNFSYYSSMVGGNPNIFLINQLREERRTGEEAAPIPASLPLPPFNKAESSSTRTVNAMSTPTNDASSVNVPTQTNDASSVNVAAQGLGSATLQNGGNLNMGQNVRSSTTHNNPIRNLNYKTNHMGGYNQNTAVPQNNYNFTNGRLVGGANINLFPSTNFIGPSGTGTAPIHNNFISEQPLNVGGQGSTIIFNVKNFNGSVQLGNLHNDPNIGTSFGAHQFANTLGVNKQLFGSGVQMTDGSCLTKNNGVINNVPVPNDNSRLGFDQNLILGDAWDI